MPLNMNFIDQLTIDGVRKRPSDGALVVNARTARTGIQLYSGHEVGRPDLATVRVFRSADEVFHQDSLSSFAHRPITNDHPREPVTADNWKGLAVGQTSDEVTAEAIYVRIPLMVSDAAAIADIEGGKHELSPGYSCDLDWTPGKTQNGEQYDAQQRKIRVNHIAIVDRGRSGPNVRIGDSWGATPINDNAESLPMNGTKTITFDGMPILVTDQAEAAISNLQARLQKLTGDMETAVNSHKAALTAKDTEIGTLTVKLSDAEKKIPTGAVLDAMVSDRVAVIDKVGKLIKDFKPDGLSNADIRRKVVVAKLGDALVKDRSDDAVSAMFDAITVGDVTGVDPFRTAMQDNGNRPAITADHGQSEYQKRLADAYKDNKAA